MTGDAPLCSVVITTGVVRRAPIRCVRPAVEGSDLCAEHLAAQEAERDERERVAADLREKLAGRRSPIELSDDPEPDHEDEDERPDDDDAVIAQPAEVSPTETQPPPERSALWQRMKRVEDRRLEAIIAKRRWQQKRAWNPHDR